MRCCGRPLPITSNAITVAAVVVSAGSSAAIDLRTERIPNVLTFSTAAFGVVLAASGLGQLSVAASLAGFGLGMLLMLPGHVLGGTGGGDVKLLGGLGSMLGPDRIVMAFLYSAIAGGLFAVAYAIARGRLQTTLRGTARLIATPAAAKQEIDAPAAGNRFPYGPAIAAGSLLVVLGY